MTEPVDYAVFYEQLAALVAGRESGTLYLKNDLNHVGIVGVRTGRIVSLVCGPKRGRPAIELIRQTRTGTVRLDRGVLSFREHELPSTENILELLSPLHATLSPVKHTGAEKAGHSSNGVAGDARVLCNLLADYLGPVAPLICDEKISAANGLSGSRQLDGVIEALAQEIEDPEEARKFGERARSALVSVDEKEPAETASSETAEAPVIDLQVLKERLCDLLIGYLGPVAPLVCEEQFVAVGEEVTWERLERMITNIAAEIGDDEETTEFVTQARQQLAAMSD